MANLVGNDIVDWSWLKNGTKAQNLSYLSKICLDSEIRQIQSAKDPEYTLWRIWTIKEASYKAITQLHHFRAYIPKKITVELINEQKAKVFSEWGEFYATSSVNKPYIHSIAYTEKQLGQNVYMQIFDGRIDRKSKEEFNRAMLEDFAQTYRRPVQQLSLKKEGELPYIYEKGARLPYRLSLSYDGGFGAYAIRPIF